MPDRLSRRRVLIPAASPGDRVLLPESESRHLARVLRAAPGDEITAVDPRGNAFRSRVEAVGAEGVRLRILEPLAAAAPPGPALIVAPPKGSRMSWLVEKAVELGAGAILPVATARGALKPGGDQAARWRRVAEAAVKQSGAGLPEISPLQPLAGILSRLPGPLIAAHPDPEALPLGEALAAVPAGVPPAFAVGPEGGWTDAERDLLLAAGARLVRLGPRILRTETAAISLLAAWTLGCPGKS